MWRPSRRSAPLRESMSAVAMARRTLAAVRADSATAESAHARALGWQTTSGATL